MPTITASEAIINVSATQLTVNPVATYYHDRFFDEIDRTAIDSARVIVPLVRELVRCQSVVDIGCGRGAWLKIFAECGSTRIVGFDGDYVDTDKLLIPSSSFRATDLSRGIEIDETFELAVCLEVAEHLPRAMSEQLIATLCKAAPAVLFSAAIPGQGGINHVNEQCWFYWTELFERRGFFCLDVIRPHVICQPRVATWYKQNAFIYIHESVIESSDSLQEMKRLTDLLDVEIVAKHRLASIMSFTGALGELRRAFAHAIRRRLGR